MEGGGGETPGCCSTFSELQGQKGETQQQPALPHQHPFVLHPQAARPGEAPASVSVPTLSKLKSQVREDYQQLAAHPKHHLFPLPELRQERLQLLHFPFPSSNARPEDHSSYLPSLSTTP